MRNSIIMLISIVLTLSISTSSAELKGYKRASVAQAWSETVVIEGADYTIEAANYKYIVETIYTGKHREIAPERKKLFHRWTKSLRHPEWYAQLCAHEIQIRDGKHSYWLPLQNVLLNAFAAEAVANSHLRLHIIYIGATDKERVFMISGFQVIQ